MWGTAASKVPTSACALSENLPMAQIPKPSQGPALGKMSPGLGPAGRGGRKENGTNGRAGKGRQITDT